MELQNLLIVLTVIGARLIVPLFIPRFPLPAVIACLLIDGIDQTIFQKYTTVNLDGYQNYDKALDIYYLSIAYLSTFKNWTNKAAFQISQFLFYYRMVGDALFQITDIRALLFIFPNTFEYFFIFVSAIALFYDMRKLTTKFLIGAAAFIWIFIKLPQEYWIHIAQLDTTDFIKETILGVPATSSWNYAISQNMWVFPVIGILALALGIVIYKVIKMLPKPDHKFTITPVVSEKITAAALPKDFTKLLKLKRNDFIEKIVFVGLIAVIFAHIFPSFQATNVEIFMGVIFIILVNAAFSSLLLKHTGFKIETLNKFFFMFIVNVVAAFIFANILAGERQVSYLIILFMAYLLTLITVLYDRFKPYYEVRFR